MDTTAVLYVEDDEADVFLMQRAWQKIGLSYPLYIARDGQEAADYLAGAGVTYALPALMLLDLKLPRMSGLELLTWLRGQRDGIRSLPVVILSSSNLGSDNDDANALGVSDYWIKPGHLRKLEEMVTSLKDILAS